MPRGRPGRLSDPWSRSTSEVLYNVAYRMVHDREDARDLAAGAFVKAYEKLGSYDPAYQFFSWIYRILVNDTLNFLKRNRPYQSLEPTWDAAAPGGPREELEARESAGPSAPPSWPCRSTTARSWS